MSIIAIDFETATSARNSACEIGATIIEDGRIRESRSWLIRPPIWPNFEPFNVKLHGISAESVKNEPDFATLWPELAPWFEGRIVLAHNAAFDIGVLRDMLKSYDLPIPENPYLCTYRLARKVWPELGKYGLKTMASHFSLTLTKHHRAEYDSLVCAEILLKALEAKQVPTVEQLAGETGTLLRSITQYGHELSSNGTKKREIPKPTPGLENPGHYFYRKNIAFSGTLESMSRAQAWKRVVDIGGFIHERVTDETHVLVTGQYDSNGKYKKSAKMMHAERMVKKGSRLQIWNEREFIQTLDRN